MRDHPPAKVKVAAAVLAAGTALGFAACSSPESTYFPSVAPTSVTVPTVDHEDVYVGVALLVAHAGDEVVVDSVSAEFASGDATIDGFVSILGGKTVWVGAQRESDLDDAGIDLDDYLAAPGTRFGSSDGPVALVVRVRADTDDAGFGAIVVGFRVNGGALQSKRFAIAARVCSAASVTQAAAGCRPSSASPIA
jgi:hypothetical protein